VLVAAASVSVAYFLGAQFGLLLRVPGATPSVLWPPNALLTCALLLVPPQHWWTCLLAVVPAHLTLSVGTGWPIPMVAGLFASNATEALIGASLLRRLSDRPTAFDSLERVLAFVVAVVLAAPLLSSFLDAAVVTTFQDEPYWNVWRTRAFSNVLTELTIVPAVIGTFMWVRGPRPPLRPARVLEATALVSGLLGVWLVAWLWPSGSQALIPGSTRAPLAFLLPFIAWAAVRFGPTGASVAILIATLLTISAAARGLSPFYSLSPGETLLGVQLLLIAAALPHLVLAAAIEERHQASKALADRLQFEELLSQMSQGFLDVPNERMDEAVDLWLRRAGERLPVDGLMLFRRAERANQLVPRAAWMRQDTGATTVGDAGEFPWAAAQVFAHREVVVNGIDDLPVDAVEDRRSFTAYGYSGGVSLPLASGDHILGCLGCVSMSGGRPWQPDVVARLRLVAEVFGNAMARQLTEDALRASETLKSAILTSLNSGVAVVDRSGMVIAVNERWHGLAAESGLRWARNGVGENLLAACERDADRCDAARRTLDGARAVLARQAPRFVFQHSSGSLDDTRYWMLSVHPLDHAVGGAVMSHTEITERKRAELDADLARAELAHMARVSTIGELTASLAHELNQPLAAIVANAQAARRLYANNGRSNDELPAVLNDIVDDGIRAGAVIQRTREMLRKETPSLARIDLGALVRDVAVLVTNDALIRQVTLRLSLPHAPVFVDGDRIQLQQVLLNLLMNALEAIGDDPAKPRLINVRARSADSTTVDVEIRDTGPGMPTPVARVFDAFYTTKPSGMGMGLPIARSIVEAHGGSIHVANHPAGGATVHFRLPLASEAIA
jgi:signal transduction histidine kinase/integral membrane sensor domain MASE1